MVDQPHTLRRLTTMERPDEHLPSCAPPQQALTTTTDLKVLSFTSGKGGVGRSHIVVNLAYALQRLGAQVMILDADLGLANIDVLLGLATQYGEKHFKVVMNTVVSAADGKAAFSRLSMVTERFLNISLDYLGFIPYDVAFSRAVRQQQALLELYPSSPAARCLHQLAQRVLDIPGSPHPKGNIQFLWRRLLTGHLQPSSKTLHVVHGGSGNSAAKESCNEE